MAILHYTLPPVVGGIERMIAAEVAAYGQAGYEPFVVGGSGWVGECRSHVIPEMNPAHHGVAGRTEGEERRRLMDQLKRHLAPIVEGSAHVSVHNVLTLDLHPALAEVVWELIVAGTATWTVWCEDISAVSRHVEVEGGGLRPLNHLPKDRVRFATISDFRKQQLREVYGLPAGRIDVIEPPLPENAIVSMPETQSVVSGLDVFERDPVVLVPAKLLPHKRLDRAVLLAEALQERFTRPLVLVSGGHSSHEPVRSRGLADELMALARERGCERSFVLASKRSGPIVDEGTVRELMLLADCVYLPSEEEGFGLPLREAAALRVPVVCSDIPPFREAAGDGTWFVHPGASPEEVARMVAEVAASPANISRRAAVQSSQRFAQAVVRLVGR